MTTTFPGFPEALFRHAIGLDSLRRWAEAETSSNLGNYPPHDIEKLDDDRYCLTMALAGFTGEDIDITLHNGLLTVAGKTPRRHQPNGRTYLHHGIACREFVRQFWLDQHVEVTVARLDEGLLRIELQRIVPDAQKPRQIPVHHDLPMID